MTDQSLFWTASAEITKGKPVALGHNLPALNLFQGKPVDLGHNLPASNLFRS